MQENLIEKLQQRDVDTIREVLNDILWISLREGEIVPEIARFVIPILFSEDVDLRKRAVAVLEVLGDSSAVPSLIETATALQDSDLRAYALEALKVFRDQRILECLIGEIKRSKTQRRPRQIVAEQLRNYPSNLARNALIYLIENDEDYLVHDIALASLLAISDISLADYWSELVMRDDKEERDVAQIALDRLIDREKQK